MELNTIQTTTIWGEAASDVNINFQRTKVEVESLSQSIIKFKGYFTTEASLKSTVPNPVVGNIAWVGQPFPGYVYKCEVSGVWTGTTDAPTAPEVDLVEYAKLTKPTGEVVVYSDLNGKLPASVIPDSIVRNGVNPDSVDIRAIGGAAHLYLGDDGVSDIKATELDFATRTGSLTNNGIEILNASHIATSASQTGTGLLTSLDIFKEHVASFAHIMDLGNTQALDQWHTSPLPKSGIYRVGNNLYICTSELVNQVYRNFAQYFISGGAVSYRTALTSSSSWSEWKPLYNLTSILTGILGQSTTLAPTQKLVTDEFEKKADETDASGNKVVRASLANPQAGEILQYDGTKWVNKDPFYDKMLQQYLAGNFMIPLISQGNGVSRLTIQTSAAVTMQLFGSGRFYTDSAGTQGESRTFTTTANVATEIYVKVPNGTSYLYVPNGINLITRLGQSYVLAILTKTTNSPLYVIYSEFIPKNLQQFCLSNSNARGDLYLSDFPSSINALVNVNNLVKMSGNVADLKGSNIPYFTESNTFSPNITGNVAELFNKKTAYLTVANVDFTYSTGATITQTMGRVDITPNATTWTTAMTDQLIIDLSAATWIASGGALLLSGAAKHSGSTAVLNAISTLTNKNVTVTVSQA